MAVKTLRPDSDNIMQWQASRGRGELVCSKCGVPKPATDYYPKRKQCKLCCNAQAVKRNKRLKEDDPDRYRETISARQRKFHKTPGGKYHLQKHNARHRGIEFNITQKDFEEWFSGQPLQCHYCQQPLTWSGNNMDSLTFDRVDSSVGYVLGNMVFACRRCNTIKGPWFTHDQMLEIAKKYLRRNL